MWIAALPLLVTHVALLVTWDLARRPVVTVLLLAAAGVAMVWATTRLAPGNATSGAAILLVALLLRLLLLPLPHSLSDDLLRYVWDGKVVNAGLNPYSLAPEDPALEELRGPIWNAMPHRDVPTVYPPLAQGLFSIAARSGAPFLTLKALLTACDLLACLLLIRMTGLLGLPRIRAALYAWNPLVTLEVAGMGHVDALGVALLVAALYFLVRNPSRPLPVALAAAGATLSKLVPVLAVPVLVRASTRGLVLLGLIALILLGTLLPIWVSTSGVPPGMARFAVSWEFNGPLYEPLWRMLDRLGVDDRVEARLDQIKTRTEAHDFWNRLYPYNYPQLHAKLLLALGFGSALLWIWRGRDPIGGTGAVFGSLLIFSATVYPWYLLWVLPAAALARQPAFLLLSLLIPLSYLPQFAEVELMPWVFAAIWVPFFITLARFPRWSTA